MDIHKTYVIDAPVEAVWAALTDPAVIERWGGGPVVMAPKSGSAFSFWDSDIHGTVLEVDPPRSMLQEWYGGDWLEPSYARFALHPDPSGGTRLELDHTGVPDDEADDFDDGWDEYYLGPLKELLESETA
jgi:uncharacterized protein YndB with AHSA1/START domain